MAVGKVKWFNNAKGFGFIREEGKDEDIFAHFSTITMDGYKTLKAGQPVSFEVEDGDKGPHASHIQPVGVSDSTTEGSALEPQSASELSDAESHELEGAH